MMKDKKVAIVSCYFQHNYGSQLQAFATQQILDDLGIKNYTIDNSGLDASVKGAKVKYYLSHITDYKIFANKMGYVFSRLYQKINKPYGRKAAKRAKAFNSYIKKFRLTSKCSSYKELADYVEREYTDVLVGSDQLWLPSNIDADYYTLNWVPKEINKISYSTSFGVSSLTDAYIAKTKAFLSRFQYISVREESAVTIVEKAIGQKPEMVCDPTLLLDGNRWAAIVADQELINKPYIMCYLIGNNPEHRKFARMLAEKTGCSIVSLPHMGKYKKVDKNYSDIEVFDAGPEEFVNLIRHANYICTDSFHATVFSILNHKEYFTFMRFKEGKGSTNTRIDSLFDIIGFDKRLVSDFEDIDKYLKNSIPYEKIDTRLSLYRKASIEFLKKALGKNDTD